MTPEPSDIFVIVPTYNESSVLTETLRPLVTAGYSVVVVDDGSHDDSFREACRLPVHVLRHPINLGQGAALQTGMDYSLRRGARAVVHFDADGQHDEEAMPHLVGPIFTGEAEVTLGSRFLAGRASDVPVIRRWMLRLAALLTRTFTGMKITDTHNGLRAFSAEAASQIRIHEDRMAHASEILGAIRKSGLRYTEVPVHIRHTDYSRRKGQSILNSVNILIDLCLRRIFP